MTDAARILLTGLHLAAVLVAVLVIAATVGVALGACQSQFFTWRDRRCRARRAGYIIGGPWSAHLRDDESLRDVYVDRDLTNWGGPR